MDNRVGPQDSDQDWRAIFSRFGGDDEGNVRLSSLKYCLQDTSYRQLIPETASIAIIERAQRDPDGHLSFDEFLKMTTGNGDTVLTPASFPPAPLPASKKRSSLAERAAKSVIPRARRPPSYLQQYNCRPPPLLLPAITCLQVALFIYDGVRLGGVSSSGPLDPQSPLLYSPYRRREVWRLVSYMLVHVGWVHLTTNLVVQLLLGIPLELVHKWWRVGTLYTCGVVAGALATSVFDPQVFLAGASGGVYAILTAHAADLVLNWSQMEFALVRLVILLLLVGTDVGLAIHSRYSAGPDRKVAYTAHLAGAVAGLLVGNLVLRNIKLQRWERALWWTSLVVFLLLMGTMVVFNIVSPEGYFPPQDV